MAPRSTYRAAEVVGHQLRRLWLDYGVLWIGAIVVGLCAVGYAHLIDYGFKTFHRVQSAYIWFPFVATPMIGGISVWLTRKFFPGAEGSGIPQVIAVLRNTATDSAPRLLSLRIVFGKVFVSFIATLGGFTIGRQGPTVHVGAALLSNFRIFYPKQLSRQLETKLERRLILAGAASGLAAAFNTPFAGVLFAIEDLSKGMRNSLSGTVLTAIIFAGLVALGIDGDYTYFGTIKVETIVGLPMIITVLATAIVTGFAGGVFAWLSTNSQRWLPAPFVSLREKQPIGFGVGCGCVIAAVGFFSGGHTFGSGYAEARGLLEGQVHLSAVYPALKMISLVASYLTGVPGGIFVPSLAIGAGIGNTMLPYLHLVSPQMAIALSMVGYLAAVTQSPITAFVIVTEMNDAHYLAIPIMSTALIASTVSRALTLPLYETLAQNYCVAP